MQRYRETFPVQTNSTEAPTGDRSQLAPWSDCAKCPIDVQGGVNAQVVVVGALPLVLDDHGLAVLILGEEDVDWLPNGCEDNPASQ